MTRDVPRVTLYVKAGCHLCQTALATLGRLRRRYHHTLDMVDISADPALMERYGAYIPVLIVGGREYRAPLFRETIERALAGAPSRGGGGG